MAVINKYIATAKVVNPSEVASRALEEGYNAHPGAIFVSIPEMGFEEPDLIYCRYGLPIPYLKIQEGWRIWVEPTVDDDSRFCYTGIVDCGPATPEDKDQFILTFISQVIYASSQGTLHLSNKDAEEPFVLGNELKTSWALNVDQALTILFGWAATGVTPGPAGGIAPLTTPNPNTGFQDTILSKKIFGE